ncbi:MAG: sulfate ABC transporter permease, partial [Lachnospiraceae bacterium]|nr:sulfate ABC transporter permease [Lachnospiraceae bacterium]
MSEQQKLLRQKKITKYVLLTLTVLFITVMLIVPLASILYNSLKEGIGYYISSITTDYVRSALFVTLLATV